MNEIDPSAKPEKAEEPKEEKLELKPTTGDDAAEGSLKLDIPNLKLDSKTGSEADSKPAGQPTEQAAPAPRGDDTAE